MQAKELIMDLTYEQGGGRESQVQPPAEVWELFFGVRVSATMLPAFRLQNKKTASDPEQRKVVAHPSCRDQRSCECGGRDITHLTIGSIDHRHEIISTVIGY